MPNAPRCSMILLRVSTASTSNAPHARHEETMSLGVRHTAQGVRCTGIRTAVPHCWGRRAGPEGSSTTLI
jgi:hypothetical protein